MKKKDAPRPAQKKAVVYPMLVVGPDGKVTYVENLKRPVSTGAVR